MHPPFRPLRPSVSPLLHTSCLAGVFLLCQPKAARAEDSVEYKYQSWQEDNGRIGIHSHYVHVDKSIGPDMNFSAMALVDSIAGATPTGELPRTPGGPTPLAHMEDRRKAWDAELSDQVFKRLNATVGYGISRESDYISRGISLNTVTDFNEKNTGLLLGYGRTDDVIHEPKLGWTKDRDKTGNDYLVGLTQVLDANTTLQTNISLGRSHGFESDPYKIVSTTMLALDPGTYYTPPENRPSYKNKVSWFLGLNHNFETLHAAADVSYRYYHDSFGINSSTVSLAWIQDVGEHFQVQPFVRLYEQSAASFYYHNPDASKVVTTYDTTTFETGTGQAPYYSSDARLSHMMSVDAGLKLTWKIRPWIAVDFTFDRYVTRGLDNLTPQDAFYKAKNFMVGLKLSR